MSSTSVQERKLAVVIAAYNEERSIAKVVQDLKRVIPEAIIVVVNDGSRDRTYEILTTLPVYALSHVTNLGQGAALQTGIDFARRSGADYIVTFDADGQHRPEDVLRLMQELIPGECEIVLGSRFLAEAMPETMPVQKLWLLRVATWFTRATTGLKVTDTHNGLRAFRATCAPALEIRMNGMAHASELLSSISTHRLRWKEVPVKIHYSEYSIKKGQSVVNLVNILWDLVWRR